MIKGIAMVVMLMLINFTATCNKRESIANNEAKFYRCNFVIHEHYKSIGKWVDNKTDALQAELAFDEPLLNNRNIDSLYNYKAHFLFSRINPNGGGGGITIKPENCSVRFTKDSIIISYKASPSWTWVVGDVAASQICMEIDKGEYPNYQTMIVHFRSY